MTFRGALLRSAVTVLTLAFAPDAGAAVDKGLPSAGSSLPLVPTKAGYEVGFDVGIDEGFTTLEVSSADAALMLDPQVIMTESQPERVKRVIVRVNNGRLRAKPYSVTILATHKIKKDNAEVSEEVERDISFVVPAATLDPPQTLTIRRDCPTWVFRGQCRWADALVTANQPKLAEITRRAWLTGIRLHQKNDLDAGGEPAGTLEPMGVIADISPNDPQQTLVYGTSYALKGSFPLGTVKGTLLIDADQLASPVTMSFEIRTRAMAPLLFVALGLGLLLGFITRSYLKGRLDINREKQKTFALLALIETTQARTKDATVSKQLADARTAANAAAQIKSSNEIAEVKSKTESAQKLFDEAQTAVRTKRTANDQAYADTLALLRAPWRVSAALDTAMEAARTELAKKLRTRDENDFTSEEQTLAGELAKVLAVSDDEVARYAVSLSGNDQIVTLLAPLMDPIGVSALRSLVKPAAAPARTVQPAERDKMIPALRAALEYVHSSGAYIDNVLQHAQILLRAQINGWEQQLAAVKLRARPRWQQWTAEALALVVKLEQAARRSGTSIDSLAPSARRVVGSLAGVLLAQVDDNDKSGVQENVDKGNFGDAVAEVEALTQVLLAQAGVVTPKAFESRDDDNGEGRPALPQILRGRARAAGRLGMLLPASGQDVPTVAVAVTVAPPPEAAATAVLAAASQRSLEVTGWVLNSIYAALIVIGGYWLFAGEWIGTLRDFAIAFFWAFTTDIGADAATSAVKGIKR